MNSYIYISSNLITNFKPYTSININKIKKNDKQIYCKNFLMYLILLKYKNNIFIKSNIHIKKYKKKIYTILRSPYRHKLARHQIALNRYNINFSTYIKINSDLKIKNFKKLLSFLKILKNFSNLFESNLIYTTNMFFSIPIKYNKIFKIIE